MSQQSLAPTPTPKFQSPLNEDEIKAQFFQKYHYLLPDERVERGPIPLRQKGELQVQMQWQCHWSDNMSMNVLYEQEEDEFVNFKGITNFVANKYVTTNKKTGVLFISPYPEFYPLKTGTHPNPNLVKAEKNLSFILQSLSYTRGKIPINSLKLTGPVSQFAIHIHVPIPEKLWKSFPDTPESEKGSYKFLQKNEILSISAWETSSRMKDRIRRVFPSWTESQGLQILTTPFFRSHLLDYYSYSRKLPMLDLDGTSPRFSNCPRIVYTLGLGLVTITAFPEKIDRAHPWIFLDNQKGNPLSLYEQAPHEQRSSIELLSPIYPGTELPLATRPYFRDLARERQRARQRDIYFKVTNMTDHPFGFDFLDNLIFVYPNGYVDLEIHATLHHYSDLQEELSPRITKISYGIKIDSLLDDPKGPSYLPSLLDKAKLEVQRLRRKEVKRRGWIYIRENFLTLGLALRETAV